MGCRQSAGKIRSDPGILRDCTPGPSNDRRDETVRSAWRHAEPDGNDLALAKAGVTGKNGPKVAHRCLSKIWPNAGTSEYLRLLAASAAVTKQGVQIISRKDRIEGCGILRDLTPDDLIRRNQFEDKVRTAWRHAEAGRNVRSLEARESRRSNKIKRNSLSGR